MRSGNHSREPADGASRCVYRICSLMPEQISGRRNLLCKEIRKPRYHGRVLDRALMRGRICGNPGGTAIKLGLFVPEIPKGISGTFVLSLRTGANHYEDSKIH